ncbi:class I SAM-dependent methyltransferase [Candidatus Dependentiae bacterium]|nr:class I SAM-dependent methyltransferase [Candidatus Dependentiae bacterium]
MQCNICKYESKYIFNAKILNKYLINYFYCNNCEFLQTEEPYWLNEAYSEAISSLDTGLVSRNISLSKFTTLFLYLFFNKNFQYLDYGGGHGLFVRMMRDIGFDFYWQDLYAKNIFARGFELNLKNNKINLITTFECFEHFVDPNKEFENMLQISSNILFSTSLLPNTIPAPDKWLYYALESEQHISFYSLKTLNFIADKYNLNIYSWGSIHFFTHKKLNRFLLYIIKYYKNDWIFKFLKNRSGSKTNLDMLLIKNKSINENSL